MKLSELNNLDARFLSVDDGKIVIDPALLADSERRGELIGAMMASVNESGYVFTSTQPVQLDRRSKYPGMFFYSIAPRPVEVEGGLSFEPVPKANKPKKAGKPAYSFFQVWEVIGSRAFRDAFKVIQTEITNDNGDPYQGTRIVINDAELFDACLPMKHCANRGHIISNTGLGVWALRAAEQWLDQSELPAKKRVLDWQAIVAPRQQESERLEKRDAIFVPDLAKDGTRMEGELPDVLEDDSEDSESED